MIVVCNRLTIAYSGLAQIQLQETDEWIVDTVRDPDSYSVRRVLTALSTSADLAFANITVESAQKRHAFVVAGWATNERGAPLRPCVWSISNALGDDWKWLEGAEDRFATRSWFLPDDQDIHLIETGVALPDRVQRNTMRQLQECYRRNTTADAYVRVLAEAVWQTPELTVGDNLLAVVLPLAATELPPGLIGATTFPLPRDQVASLSITPSAPDGEFYAPNYTCGPLTYHSVTYGFGLEDYGPERPPWHQGILVLSPRMLTEQDPSIRPVVSDRYRVTGFSLVAEYRREREDCNRPTPAIVRIGSESPDFAAISIDVDLFVLSRDRTDAEKLLTEEWSRGVAQALHRLGLPDHEVQAAADSLDRLNTRGEAISWLRNFFQQPIEEH